MTADKVGYVYCITNTINNKKYVGLHKSNIFDDSYWGSGKLINQAYEKYGKENFIREILDWADSYESLQEKEKYWIENLGTFEDGYNLTLGGDGGVTWGEPENNPSKRPEVREKIRQQKLLLGDDHPMKTLENRKRISDANKGRLVGDKNPMKRPEVREKHLLACRSEEHRKKLSERGRALGENHPSKSQKHRELVSKAFSKYYEEHPEAREKSAERLRNLTGAKNHASKPVMIIETGQKFSCIRELKDFLGVGGWVIHDRLTVNKGKPISSKVLGDITIDYVKKEV